MAELELDVEIDVGVEAEIEIEAEVEAEVEIEVEVEMEAPVIECELEVEVEGEVEFDAPVIEIEIEAPVVEIECDVEIDCQVDMAMEVDLEAPIVEIEAGGSGAVASKNSRKTCCCLSWAIVFLIFFIGSLIYAILLWLNVLYADKNSLTYLFAALVDPLVWLTVFLICIGCYCCSKKNDSEDQGLIIYADDAEVGGGANVELTANVDLPQVEIEFEAPCVDIEYDAPNVEVEVEFEAPVIEIEADIE